MLGYERALYLLAFDHRTAFRERLPLASDPATIEDAKRVVYEGFLAALRNGISAQIGGVIVDEELAAEVSRDARRRGLVFAMPVEAAGVPEFDFAYGEAFEDHIDAFQPTFAKALVRYDPSERDLNERQGARLARLSAALERRPTKLMLEVLVDEQGPRVELLIQAIGELRSAGVEPDVWKVDSLAGADDCRRVSALCRADGRHEVGVVVLGRGAHEQDVVVALRAAASTEGYIGFAVGRTIWGTPLEAFLVGKTDRQTAAAEIAAAYARLVAAFGG